MKQCETDSMPSQSLILMQAESTFVLKKYLQDPQDGSWGGAGWQRCMSNLTI